MSGTDTVGAPAPAAAAVPAYQLRLTYPGSPTFVEPIQPGRVWALVTRVHESGTRSWRCQRVEVRVIIGEYETIIAAAPQPEPGR